MKKIDLRLPLQISKECWSHKRPVLRRNSSNFPESHSISCTIVLHQQWHKCQLTSQNFIHSFLPHWLSNLPNKYLLVVVNCMFVQYDNTLETISAKIFLSSFSETHDLCFWILQTNKNIVLVCHSSEFFENQCAMKSSFRTILAH